MERPEMRDTVVVDGVEVTTYYKPARRGARPDRRLSQRADGKIGNTVGWTDRAMAALKILNDSRTKGAKRISEASLRTRLAKLPGSVSGATVGDLLVKEGIVQKDERLDGVGNPTASYLILTDEGTRLLGRMFGDREEGGEWLSARLRELLGRCVRQEVANLLRRQLTMIESGEQAQFHVDEDESIVFVSRIASPNYVKIAEFFGYVGSMPEGTVADFKEISGALHKGIRDSVKALEGLRSDIAKMAEWEIGTSLETLGVRGAHLLYWIPFSGDLRPDGHTIWGEIPSISTRDVEETLVFYSTARVVALVENRAALDHLFASGLTQDGWLAICTEGMPKHQLFVLLQKLEKREHTFMIWVDHDVGGLRIAEKLLMRLRDIDSRSEIVVVPHPGNDGLKIEVPSSFLTHKDPAIRTLAQDISRLGVVYQEEVFTLMDPEALERIVSLGRGVE